MAISKTNNQITLLHYAKQLERNIRAIIALRGENIFLEDLMRAEKLASEFVKLCEEREQ